MSIEGEGKFPDSLLVCWSILAHNLLKNKTLCVISYSVKFSDSPQCTPSSPAHHTRAWTRALVVHGLDAVAPAHHNPRSERQHPASRAEVPDRGEGSSDIGVRWRQLRRCQPAAHFCGRR